MSDSWPAGVPETMWNYGLLKAKDIPQIPMMGVQFAPQFLYSFAIGGAFLAYFAWTRFTTRTTATDAFSYRVLKDIRVAYLGGSGAMLRAYLLYLTTLMFVYVAMTFFGKLVLQAVNGLNLAGIQVDTASLKFDSPQWPLVLAFGLAGLAPIVTPLRLAEDWLFTRAYRAVGIPVRIEHTTRNLIDILDAHARGGETPLALDLSRRRGEIDERIADTWIKEMLDREGKTRRAVTLFAELELLVDWADGGRGSWPGPEVSNAVRRLEHELAKEAGALIASVLERMDEARSKIRQPAGSDKGEARRKRELADVLERARVLRNELLAVLAVYAERDPTLIGGWRPEKHAGKRKTEGTKDDTKAPVASSVRPELGELLGEANPPNLAGAGPEAGLLLCMAPIALLYLTFAWQGLHQLIAAGALNDDWRAVLATTGIEMSRIMAAVWLPLLAAFAARQYYHDRGEWTLVASEDPSAWTVQRLVTTGMAVTIAVLGLLGVALLFAFAISPSVSRFQELLFRGPRLVLYMPTFAVVTIPITYYAIKGADARSRGDDAAAIRFGIWSAMFVLLAQASHLAFWSQWLVCTQHGTFLLDLFSAGCFRFYGGLDFLVYPSLAFLATAVFGNPSSVTTAERRVRLLSVRGAHVASALAALVIVGAATTASAEPVYVGFRSDAEPFSFQIDPDRAYPDPDSAHRKHYAGFIADLCYYIFRESDYEVIEKKITIEDRFKLLETGGARGGIDVLCDPVTMRFSEPNRAKVGLFSPIVFASGITYLQVRGRAADQTVYIAYVENTTAMDVLAHACTIDLFGVVRQEDRENLAVMCRTAEVVRDLDKMRQLGMRAASETDAAEAEAFQKLKAHVIRKAPLAIKDEIAAAKERKANSPEEKQDRMQAIVEQWQRLQLDEQAPQRLASCPDAARCRTTVEAIEHDFGRSCQDVALPDRTGAEPTTSEIASGGTAAKADPRDGVVVYRFCPMPSHEEAIDWLCSRRFGDDSRKTLIYLGDRDIILGKLRTWNNRETRCPVESDRGADDLTYEPYALMVSRQGAHAWEIAQLVQRRVYEFFSFKGLAVSTFDAYFPDDVKMSPLLGYLFLLNGVEEERRFVNPTEVEDPEAPEGDGNGKSDNSLISSATQAPPVAPPGPHP